MTISLDRLCAVRVACAPTPVVRGRQANSGHRTPCLIIRPFSPASEAEEPSRFREREASQQRAWLVGGCSRPPFLGRVHRREVATKRCGVAQGLILRPESLSLYVEWRVCWWTRMFDCEFEEEVRALDPSSGHVDPREPRKRKDTNKKSGSC